jgi:hypothetical protein
MIRRRKSIPVVVRLQPFTPFSKQPHVDGHLTDLAYTIVLLRPCF